MRQAYFDVKVVSPFARSNANLESAQLFKNAEHEDPRAKRGSRKWSTPTSTTLVFTSTGGMAPQSHLVMKRLAEKLSEKQNVPVSVVSGWLRCKAELCAASHDAAVRQSHSLQEAACGEQHRARSGRDTDGRLTVWRQVRTTPTPSASRNPARYLINRLTYHPNLLLHPRLTLRGQSTHLALGVFCGALPPTPPLLRRMVDK